MMATVHEIALREQGCPCVAGVDEVGRGPLAGPVVAAAAMVPDDDMLRRFLLARVRDSKVMKPVHREEMAKVIRERCRVAVAEATVEEIDALNIREATLVAMRRALDMLGDAGGVMVDGNVKIPKLDIPQVTIIKGDGCELAVACASVVAKVHRDALMADLARVYPAYGWQHNAGYGTAEHLAALQAHGVTPHHRLSFAPVRAMIEAQQEGAPRAAAA